MGEKTIDESKIILAIDHGTSGAKVALVKINGEIIDFDFEPTPIYHTPDGGVEQDPHEWWAAITGASRRLMSKGTVPADGIAAICCSSTFSSTVMVDKEGEAIGRSLTWMDCRGAPYVRDLMGGLINIEGYSLGNAWRWVRKAGGAPALSGKDEIGHVLFVKETMPEVYAGTHKFLDSKDYLNLRLTGKFAASHDSITLFWITDNRDIDNIHYDDDLIKRLGVDREKFPELAPSTSVLGPLTDQAGADLGVAAGTPVILGSPDLQSACVGSGAVGDYQGHIYVGTSSWLLCHVPYKKTDIFHIIASLPSAIPGRYFCANEQDIAGGCLQFLIDNLLYHQNELRAEKPPEDVYQKLDAIAARVNPGSGGVIFTPWLNGEKTPVEDHTLRGGFHNIGLQNNIDHFVRAVMEGVALNSRWVLQYVEKFTGRRLDPLNIIGGGARSAAWRQIFADVLGRTVRCVEDPVGCNARGAAYISGVALGLMEFDQIESLVRFEEVHQPNLANTKYYDNLFREFVGLYKNNRKMFVRMNEFKGRN